MFSSFFSIRSVLFLFIAALIIVQLLNRFMLSPRTLSSNILSHNITNEDREKLSQLFPINNHTLFKSARLTPLESYRMIAETIGKANQSYIRALNFFDPHKVKEYYREKVWSNYSTGSDLLVMSQNCSSKCLGNFLSNYFEMRTCARLAGQ